MKILFYEWGSYTARDICDSFIENGLEYKLYNYYLKDKYGENCNHCLDCWVFNDYLNAKRKFFKHSQESISHNPVENISNSERDDSDSSFCKEGNIYRINLFSLVISTPLFPFGFLVLFAFISIFKVSI